MEPYWVETGGKLRIAIVQRPMGGSVLAAEMREMKAAGVDVLVSMLPEWESRTLGLADECAACEAAEISFRSFPVRDRETPDSMAEFAEFVDSLRMGRSVAAHCQGSIGRGPSLLACVMCAEGYTAAEAFRLLTEARGWQVPDTPEQMRWVEGFAAHLKHQEG